MSALTDRGSETVLDPVPPVLAGVLLLGAGLALAQAGGGASVPWGFVASSLAAEMLLATIGLGAALGSAEPGARWVALASLAVGGAIAMNGRHEILPLLGRIPNAAAHRFLVGPIAGLGAGLALLAPSSLRRWLLPPAFLVYGAALALAAKLLDPSLHDPLVPWLSGLSGVAILLAVALGAARTPRPIASIAAPILGAWSLAVALLYGGATLAVRSETLSPPTLKPFRTGPVLNVPFPEFDDDGTR